MSFDRESLTGEEIARLERAGPRMPGAISSP